MEIPRPSYDPSAFHVWVPMEVWEDLLKAKRVWDELSIIVACSSPDGSAELDQVRSLLTNQVEELWWEK